MVILKSDSQAELDDEAEYAAALVVAVVGYDGVGSMRVD